MRPALQFGPELLQRAQGLSVVFLDVDGVLTDGGLFFSAAGETLKRFNVHDGHGLKLLQSVGYTVAVVTGRDSRAVRTRLSALGITHGHFGVVDKVAAAQSVLDRLGQPWGAAAAMGDDWPDLALMRRCALAVAPANAHPEVRNAAAYVTDHRGGEGAVRELCDLLLMACGKYGALLDKAAA